jgi:hypothetical protein
VTDETLRPDIQAAADRMASKFGARREIRRLGEYLWEGETVQHLAGGAYGGGLGVLALTDRRLLFLRDGWVNKTTEDFPIEKISSVEWRSGFSQGTLTVYASGNKAEIKQIINPDGKSIADAIRARLTGSPPVGPAASAVRPSMEGIGDQLTTLWNLVQAGALTRGEFEAAKAQLLGPASTQATIPGRAPGEPQPRQWSQ